MVREVLTISVGQGGIQLGNAIWSQYCKEHDIKPNGEREEDAKTDDLYFHTFFEETAAGQYVPRNLSVDLEPTVLDDIRRGPYAGMFHPEFLVNWSEGRCCKQLCSWSLHRRKRTDGHRQRPNPKACRQL